MTTYINENVANSPNPDDLDIMIGTGVGGAKLSEILSKGGGGGGGSSTGSLEYNVKDYNARGDGVTDDTAAFNYAISKLPRDGVLLVPPGDYLINGWANGSTSDYPLGGILCKNFMTIKFMPGARLIGQTTTMDNYAIINITACRNVNILGGEIVGDKQSHIVDLNGQWGYGVAVVGSQDITIRDTIASWCFGDGFYVGHDRGAGTESQRIKLIDCIADNNRRQGLSVTGAIDVTIRGGVYKNTSGHLPESGIDLEPNPTRTVKDIKISGVIFDKNYGHGLQIGSYSSEVYVSNCIAKNQVGGHGFYSGYANNSILEDCHAINNGVNGFSIQNSQTTKIIGGSAKDNKAHGVYIADTLDCIIDSLWATANSQAADWTYSNITVDKNCTDINIMNCTTRRGIGAKQPTHGIAIISSLASDCIVRNNDCKNGGKTSGFTDLGTRTIKTGGNRQNDGTWS